ncbi:MAG: AAA family ATPase [Bdellovibrionota bacterium]
MKLLIIDVSTEAQARCAKKIEPFNRSDVEMLDLKIKLANDKNYKEILTGADVAILGADLGQQAITVAREISGACPWMNIIMFVKDEFYGGSSFRSAHSVGVRKVFADTASSLDFLQELVAIHSEFRKEGRAREGVIVAVNHAKGGVGATSVCAALAEVCGIYNKRTLLWDLDVETRDLSRSLTASGMEAKVVSSWINGSREITRESLKDALLPISNDVSILIPPDSMAESMDLVCHTDSISLCSRVLELSRVLFDVIIIDTGGRMGPATGSVVRNSDKTLIVVDDTILGLTAADLYLNFVKSLVGTPERIRFLINQYTGNLLTKSQMEAELEPVHQLGAEVWDIEPIYMDPRASLWPASGRTLYSLGSRNTKIAIKKLAISLGITLQGGVVKRDEEQNNFTKTKDGGFFKKLFG